MSDFEAALKQIADEMDDMRKRFDSLDVNARSAFAVRLRELTSMTNSLVQASRLQRKNELQAAELQPPQNQFDDT